jgi:hypothetical protein
MLAGAAGHNARRNHSLKQRARSAVLVGFAVAVGLTDGRADPDVLFAFRSLA